MALKYCVRQKRGIRASLGCVFPWSHVTNYSWSELAYCWNSWI